MVSGGAVFGIDMTVVLHDCLGSPTRVGWSVPAAARVDGASVGVGGRSARTVKER